MQKHIAAYRKYFSIGDQDPTPNCEMCGNQGNDLHHITSRGLKSFEYEGKVIEDINDVRNIIALCRDCHNKSHGGEYTKRMLYKVHKIIILRCIK